MKQFLRLTLTGIIVCLFLTTVSGCGSSNSDAPAFLGTHPAGWEEPLKHGPQYVLTPDQCIECHGKDLRGGIVKIDCIGCHWQDKLNQTVHISAADPTIFPPQPPISWDRVHGKYAKLAPGGSLSSFFACQNCHGGDLKGTGLSVDMSLRSPTNTSGTMISCSNSLAGCHNMWLGPTGPIVNPPHAGGWNDTTNFIGASHTTTNAANAVVCLPCHRKVKSHIWLTSAGWVTFGNLSSAVLPGDATNGCYNNTMCHARNLPTPLPVLP